MPGATASTNSRSHRNAPVPYRPQTNGKIERFHRILLEEWAYIRDWHTDTERTAHDEHFTHFYNHHRAHGELGWSTPIATLKDNVPGHHT